MQHYPTMLFANGDTTADYRIAQDAAEVAELNKAGFYGPGETRKPAPAPKAPAKRAGKKAK